jgi:hypothetical protein
MKAFLTSTTGQLAAVMAYFCSTVRADLPHLEGFEYRLRHAPMTVDPSRISAYLRRRRLPVGSATRARRKGNQSAPDANRRASIPVNQLSATGLTPEPARPCPLIRAV